MRTFIRKCPCCQKMSAIKPVIHSHPFHKSTFVPWYRRGVDTIGPFPPDQYGNTYILNVQDTMFCTRFCVLYSLKTTEAAECARCLLHLFGNFGTPSQLFSDNGSQFVNDIIAELTSRVGCEHPSLSHIPKKN